MIPNEILFAIVAGVAFYVGYRMGRLSALAEVGGTHQNQAGTSVGSPRSPLPGPATSEAPQAPRRNLPRTAAPPPARAGLMDTGESSKSSDS